MTKEVSFSRKSIASKMCILGFISFQQEQTKIRVQGYKPKRMANS